MKYTYACPGGPNMTSVRAVRPRAEWAARSRGPRYASVSTIRPARTLSPSSCTRCMPMSSRATARVLRAKKASGSFLPRVTACDGNGILYNRPRRGADGGSCPLSREYFPINDIEDLSEKSHEAGAETGTPSLVAVVDRPAGGACLGQCLPPAGRRLFGGGSRRDRADGV